MKKITILITTLCLSSMMFGFFWEPTCECKDGDCDDGMGFVECSDGYTYFGQFKNESYHGYGVITFPEGDKLTGEFRNGDLYGCGVMELIDGRTFQIRLDRKTDKFVSCE